MKILPEMYLWTRKNWFNLGSHHHPDLGIFEDSLTLRNRASFSQFGSSGKAWPDLYEILWDGSVCTEKNETKLFFVISSIKLVRFWWNLAHNFMNRFATESVNVFHLTWIMSPHYLVKLENAYGARATVELLEKETPEFTLTVASKFARFQSSWLQVWKILHKRCSKHSSLIWTSPTNWNSDWERSGPAGSCRHQSFNQSIFIDFIRQCNFKYNKKEM